MPRLSPVVLIAAVIVLGCRVGLGLVGPSPVGALTHGWGLVSVRDVRGHAATSSARARPYVVVGLGDSVPAAGGCDCTSYVSLVGRQMAERLDRSSEIDNYAVGGLTTTGLEQQLGRSALRTDLARADLVIITIGANDFDPTILTTGACQPAPQLPCYRATLAAQRGWLASVLDQVNHLASGSARIVVTGYWNVFLDGAVGQARGPVYVTDSAALTLVENAQIKALSDAADDTYVDIYAPFKGDGSLDDTSLLAPDGDHPDDAGHAAIARAVLASLT